MDIQHEKLSLIEWISRLSDSSIIEKLREIQNNYSKTEDWWHSLKKEELESINRGLKDIEEGRVHSHETVRKVYEKYL
jgi:predicted transcriptional regulator